MPPAERHWLPGGTMVGIDGYLQAFIRDVNRQKTDDAIGVLISNCTPCIGDPGSPPSPGDNSISAPAEPSVLVRMVRTG